jgi:DNA-binding NarL/FixJ family response regulator
VSQSVRVLLVDDHPLVRAGIRRVLESRAGLTIVGEAPNGLEALRLIEESRPDVVVLDLAMPEMDGLELLERLRDRSDSLRILVLTMHAQREYIRRALQAGADGYLLKESAVQELLVAVESVLGGKPYYSPAVAAELARAAADPPGGKAPARPRLTGREREVLSGIARGLSTKEIAAELDISGRTVETHRANLMRKLELKSIALLTQYAMRVGMLDAGSQGDGEPGSQGAGNVKG